MLWVSGRAVAQWLTLDRRAMGSSLTGITALCQEQDTLIPA